MVVVLNYIINDYLFANGFLFSLCLCFPVLTFPLSVLIAPVKKYFEFLNVQMQFYTQ